MTTLRIPWESWGGTPVGAETDQLLIHGDGDSAAHADDHCLAFHGGEAVFPVGDQVRGDLAEAFGIADQGFGGGPFALELFACQLLLALGDGLELGVDVRFLGFVEGEPGEAAFVVDGNGGFILDRPLDIVDADDIAKDLCRVRTAQGDGGPVKARNEALGRARRMCIA
jgi:hypothetical protein